MHFIRYKSTKIVAGNASGRYTWIGAAIPIFPYLYIAASHAAILSSLAS
jgi:VIT1/CCC1 family predicted Fe2+/Mn2+ transporter